VPGATVNEFVDGDIYRWGSLMAGAFVGSLPLVILYALFRRVLRVGNDWRGERVSEAVILPSPAWLVTLRPTR